MTYTESIADQTAHFADVIVRENVAYGYDDLMMFVRFSVRIGLE